MSPASAANSYSVCTPWSVRGVSLARAASNWILQERGARSLSAVHCKPKSQEVCQKPRLALVAHLTASSGVSCGAGPRSGGGTFCGLSDSKKSTSDGNAAQRRGAAAAWRDERTGRALRAAL